MATLPTTNQPRPHRKTTQLPVEIAEGSIFTTASTYGTAGDFGMVDRKFPYSVKVPPSDTLTIFSWFEGEAPFLISYQLESCFVAHFSTLLYVFASQKRQRIFYRRYSPNRGTRQKQYSEN